MKDKLGWGIIGCGDVVERKSGPSLAMASRSRIVAMMRRDRAKAQAMAQRFGAALGTDDARAVIEHPDVDIVYVATPPSTHMEYAVAAAKAGKHVLVEKPMAMSAAQGRRMIEAANGSGVRLFVAYYRRFHLHIRWLRDQIAAGRIGRPVQAFIDLAKRPTFDESRSWLIDAAYSGGGIFVDVGVHRLDALVFMLGPVESSCGVRTVFDADSRVEQAVVLAVRFRSGAQAVATGDFYSGRKADSFAIHGTDGAIILDNFDSRKGILRSGGKEESFAFPAPEGTHVGQVRHIESVLLDGAQAESTGEDGLITEMLLDSGARATARAEN